MDAGVADNPPVAEVKITTRPSTHEVKDVSTPALVPTAKRDAWDFFVDHDSPTHDDGKGCEAQSSHQLYTAQPAWDHGVWMIEAGPADGNWASFESLCVISSNSSRVPLKPLIVLAP